MAKKEINKDVFEYEGVLLGYNFDKRISFPDSFEYYVLALTIHYDPSNPTNTKDISNVEGLIDESYWKRFLEPRIKNYDGRVLVVINKKQFEKIDLLDLNENEKSFFTSYKGLEERLRELEETVKKIDRKSE